MAESKNPLGNHDRSKDRHDDKSEQEKKPNDKPGEIHDPQPQSRFPPQPNQEMPQRNPGLGPEQQAEPQLGINPLANTGEHLLTDVIQDQRQHEPGIFNEDARGQAERAMQADDRPSTLLSPGEPSGDPMIHYTSSPIDNFRLNSDYVFDKGHLYLKPEDEARFVELLQKQPLTIQNRIRKLDTAWVDEQLRKRPPGRRTGVDTTAGSMGPGARDGEFDRQ